MLGVKDEAIKLEHRTSKSFYFIIYKTKQLLIRTKFINKTIKPIQSCLESRMRPLSWSIGQVKHFIFFVYETL